MLDRLPWIDFSVNDGSIPNQDAVLLKQMFNSEFMKKYKPLTYGFVTSPELSVHRKGKEGRLVNRKNVKLFNECMEAEKEVIKEGAKKYTTIETDPYQGNIKQFIMDLVETITEDVRENIRETLNLTLIVDAVERQNLLIISEVLTDNAEQEIQKRARELVQKFDNCGMKLEILNDQYLIQVCNSFTNMNVATKEDSDYQDYIPHLVA